MLVRPSPWRLGPAEAALAAEWFDGWLGAACEQDAEIAAERRRPTPGRPAGTVGHDLLALASPSSARARRTAGWQFTR